MIIAILDAPTFSDVETGHQYMINAILDATTFSDVETCHQYMINAVLDAPTFSDVETGHQYMINAVLDTPTFSDVWHQYMISSARAVSGPGRQMWRPVHGRLQSLFDGLWHSGSSHGQNGCRDLHWHNIHSVWFCGAWGQQTIWHHAAWKAGWECTTGK